MTKDGDVKVTINSVDYYDKFLDIQITGRENGVSSAIIVADNSYSDLWMDADAMAFHTLKESVMWGGSYLELFDGVIREPSNLQSLGGAQVILKCKGLGAALEVTHCRDQFGYMSNQASLNTVEEILEDLVDNSVNKSYSSANNTGYALTKTYIPTIDAGLSIPFFNAPYQTCKSVVDLICMLDTAYRDGATAGPHYFVDVDGNLRVKTIGTQQVDGGGGGGDWGIYYHGLAVTSQESTLTEGIDFTEYALIQPTDEYANNVVLAFDLRKPAYDYWTESSTDWDDVNADWTLDAATYIVGAKSLQFNPNNQPASVYVYMPIAYDLGWDVTQWGSEKSIPYISWYEYITTTNMTARLVLLFEDLAVFGGAHVSKYFYLNAANYTVPSDINKWKHFSYPIGPYYSTTEEAKTFSWDETVAPNAPSWSTINGVCFQLVVPTNNGHYTYIDDLHLGGKVIREAVDTSEVTSYNEYQKVLLSRTPFDDSGIAADDSGLAGQLAYGELLRRVTPPRTFTCTVSLKPFLKPGEYWTIYAGKKPDGTFRVNGETFRTLQYTHHIRPSGYTTDLVLTDDVLNSFPLSKVDARAVLNEYLLENNSKATDMQGGEVDLLIPHLRREY